jgi:nucleotide-binding universal stress UspA family protein
VSYRTLLVHLEIWRSNSRFLKIAANLAEHFDANLVGIAACASTQNGYEDRDSFGALHERGQTEIGVENRRVEAEFREALVGYGGLASWCHAVAHGTLSDYVAHEARGADLVVTGLAKDSVFDTSRSINIGDLIMQTGRPVLFVPVTGEVLRPARILVCWNDARESRRAIVDALPMLKKATHVTIVEIVDEEHMPVAEKRLHDLSVWLETHGVVANRLVATEAGDVGSSLYALAQKYDVDVIVAGAYGHSRLREWTLGGVTKGLLSNTDRCLLLSH